MDQWLNLLPWPPRRASTHQPSPLGPSGPSPIATQRNPYGQSPAMPAHHLLGTPSPSSPRTPLSFLSNSPGSLYSSLSSSPGYELRTPLTSLAANSASPSSPLKSRLADLAPFPKRPVSGLHLTIDPKPQPHRLSISDISLSSIDEHPAISPIDHLDYLKSGPPSPPIIVPPADLLELPPNRDPDADHQHSIASPFVNLNVSSSPNIAHTVTSRRSSGDRRRSSSLANELSQLTMYDHGLGVMTDYDPAAPCERDASPIPPPRK